MELNSNPKPNVQAERKDELLPPQQDEFPKAGVRLKWIIEEFIPSCGGREKLLEMTTGQVCENITKYRTRMEKVSYCQMLKAAGRNDAYADTASVFVSHAFEYKFLDTVDALAFHLQDEYEEVIIWWDQSTQDKELEF